MSCSEAERGNSGLGNVSHGVEDELSVGWAFEVLNASHTFLIADGWLKARKAMLSIYSIFR